MPTKIHISTALFGAGRLHRSIPVQESSDYDITLKVYDDHNTHSRHNAMHPRLKGKIPKMLEWMKYDADYYVWMDAPFVITSSKVGQVVANYISGYDMCLFKHPWHKNIRDEVHRRMRGLKARSSNHFPKIDGEPITEQYRHYLSDDTFTDDKMFSCGMLVYSRNLVNNLQNNLMKDWFFHTVYWSIADQVSIPYLLHKWKTNYNVNTGDIYNNELAIYTQ